MFESGGARRSPRYARVGVPGLARALGEDSWSIAVRSGGVLCGCALVRLWSGVLICVRPSARALRAGGGLMSDIVFESYILRSYIRDKATMYT